MIDTELFVPTLVANANREVLLLVLLLLSLFLVWLLTLLLSLSSLLLLTSLLHPGSVKVPPLGKVEEETKSNGEDKTRGLKFPLPPPHLLRLVLKEATQD